ncbi:anti-sigma factor [Phenylobacterium sp.]|uniref:anti-sigma factor family protein n=1 Tax=Phenylobacterium sp. TaxID=1871053 RepID=UPI003561DF43
MTACPDKEALLHGLLDGELDAANAQAFEAHLKTCQGCAQALGELQALSGRLSAPGVGYRAPAALRQRIEAMSEAPAAPRRRLRQAAPWALTGTFAAIAASLAIVSLQPTGLALEDQLVSSHVRSTLALHLVDVETSDRHVVKPWFNGKIDFAPPVVELADSGYPLVGGRLDYVGNRVVAALVYRRNRHVINLFIWPSKPGLSLPPVPATHSGYSVEHWRSGGLEFWAVSDIEARDLQSFHQAFAIRTQS